MKSYKIKKTSFNNRQKVLEIEICKGPLSLPYSKLMLRPKSKNPIVHTEIDKELGGHCVTYLLKDGQEDSVPVDAFLDYNKDPDYIRSIELHKLTIQAINAVKKSGISKREIARRMNTSMSQLARILDPANYTKTFDQLLKLFTLIGAEVKIDIKQAI